ncbi:hypothetical protein [Fluviispira sanaruensis]|uniref:Uncharacterized protein n=1 Tax=Fluviispira sanaruensis TaxID=2493639 RepID=A0A4V0P2I6_FLUSA|nr:hypothetical protein [Fluviispira sanaruensis]BBH53357.1 hypothetical protein JCM31447_18000 [Fluviispira sanaruensis]
MTMQKYSKIISLLSIAFFSVTSSNLAYSVELAHTSQLQHNTRDNQNGVYNIFVGNNLIKSNNKNRLKRSLSYDYYSQNLLNGYQLPSLDHIQEYVTEHNNALPDTWGAEEGNKKTWAQPKLLTELGKNISTELLCTNVSGCNGEISFSMIGGFFLSNYETQQSFYASLVAKTSDGSDFKFISDAYLADPRKPGSYFKAIIPKNDWSTHYSYKVKYGDPIAYFMIDPKLKILSVNGNKNQIFDGSETQSAGTFWKLQWDSLMGAGTQIDNTYSISHGLTTTDTASLGYQLGVSMGTDEGFFNANISTTISQSWQHSASVQDIKTYSTNLIFLPKEYDQVVGYYNLMLGFYTQAPLLEHFLDPNNSNGFNYLLNNSSLGSSFAKLELARALPVTDKGVQSNIDAQSPSGEFIHATVEEKAI